MSRIVHICGMQGSGKTTLVRAFMSRRGPWVALNRGGRKLPIGHLSDTPGRQLFVAGAYDEGLQTSGCDTIKDNTEAYDLIRAMHDQGHDVLYEGLFMMNHTKGIELWNRTRSLVVLRLTTSPEDCRAGIVARRAAQGNHEPMAKNFEQNFQTNLVRATNYAHKLKQLDCPVYKVTRDEALGKLVEVLG